MDAQCKKKLHLVSYIQVELFCFQLSGHVHLCSSITCNIQILSGSRLSCLYQYNSSESSRFTQFLTHVENLCELPTDLHQRWCRSVGSKVYKEAQVWMDCFDKSSNFIPLYHNLVCLIFMYSEFAFTILMAVIISQCL